MAARRLTQTARACRGSLKRISYFTRLHLSDTRHVRQYATIREGSQGELVTCLVDSPKMADRLTLLAPAAEQIVRLSSVDQSTSRCYIRLALCYRRNETNLRNIIDRLTPAVKSTITYFLILAGIVRAATDDANDHEGRLEVAISIDRVKTFKPITKSLIRLNVPTYETLCAASIPPSDLINEIMVPLPDTPVDEDNSKAFAIQVNSINGGYVIALYLHHCVGDFATLKMIVEHISSNTSPRALTINDLTRYTDDQSTIRSELTDQKGYNSEFAKLVRCAHVKPTHIQQLMSQIDIDAPNNACCLFSFDVKLLNEARSIINARASVQVTTWAVLSAILWKSITRARVDREPLDLDENDFKFQSSTLCHYVDLRHIIPLDATYAGNSGLELFVSEPIHKLMASIDAIDLARAASAIMRSYTGALPGRARSTIAAINEATKIKAVELKGMFLSSDLAILDHSGLNLKKATLNLGLGEPEWARQISMSRDSFIGCVIQNQRAGLWDVTVQIPQPTMRRLIADTGFMQFVKH